MLLAKVKKRLRDVVVPELRRGDGLLFDYRILHRGRANLSHLEEEEDLSECEEDYDYECVEKVKSEEGVSNGTRINNKDKDKDYFKRRRGSDRPVLVLTFARRWFVDVCNFPKRSIFSQVQVQGAGHNSQRSNHAETCSYDYYAQEKDKAACSRAKDFPQRTKSKV